MMTTLLPMSVAWDVDPFPGVTCETDHGSVIVVLGLLTLSDEEECCRTPAAGARAHVEKALMLAKCPFQAGRETRSIVPAEVV